MHSHQSAQPPAAQPLPIPTSSNRLHFTFAPPGTNGLPTPASVAAWFELTHIWYNAQFLFLFLTLLYLFLYRIDVLAICAQYWEALPVSFKPCGLVIKARLLMQDSKKAALVQIARGSLEGKVICVTGANGAAGYETVWHALVTGKAKRVYAGVRDEDTKRSVCNRIQERLRSQIRDDGDDDDAKARSTDRFRCIIMDHSSLTLSYAAGKTLLEALEADGEAQLDAFVGTVGTAWLPQPVRPSSSRPYESEDGIEWMVAINAVNCFALLLTILPKLHTTKGSSASRIVLYSSIAHTWCTLPIFSYGSAPRWTSWNAILRDQTHRYLLSRYGFSKLTQLQLLSALSRALASHAEASSLLNDTATRTVAPRLFAINPGEINSTFVDRMLAGASGTSTTAAALAWFLSTPVGATCRRAFLLSASDGATAGLYALACNVNHCAEQGWGYTYVTYPQLAGTELVAGTIPSAAARDDVGRVECWNLVRSKLFHFFKEKGENGIAQFLTTEARSNRSKREIALNYC